MSPTNINFERLERSTAVRLIRIMRERINGDIACMIFQADREEVPVTKYQALSYLWGNQNPTRRIYLQDNNEGWRPFALHENLWKFLDHAWRKEMFDTPFWTDRLCLDQSDHDEVARQVLLMGEIYSKANRVVVWLDIWYYDLEIILKALEWNKRLDRDKNAFQSGRLRLIRHHQHRLDSGAVSRYTTSNELVSELQISMELERFAASKKNTERQRGRVKTCTTSFVAERLLASCLDCPGSSQGQ